MSKKFYIADWHYGHANIMAYDNRPFTRVDDMNKALVERWNRVVSPGDIVYVLGDMFWVPFAESMPVLDSLYGQKFLIKGNHDRCNDGRFLKKFVKVIEYMEVDDADRKVSCATIQSRALRIIFTDGITSMGMCTIRSSST